jgi:hypothetical protein
MASNSRNAFEEHYSANHVYGEMVRYIEHLVTRSVGVAS